MVTDKQVEYAREVPIASIVGVKVRRGNIKCPLPNHSDSTPSFLIDENNGYHCFGCGAHGNNAIDFLQDIHPSSSFKEIVMYLNDNY